MCRSTHQGLAPRPFLAAGRPSAPRCPALPRVANQAAAVQTTQHSQILPLSSPEGQRLTRRQELEAQARALLEQDRRWHEDALPPNMVAAHSPKHFKQLVTGARQGQLLVVDFLRSDCHGCRTLHPKLKQLAANNADCLFIKVNTDEPALRELAEGLGVTKLPYFQLWRDVDLVAQFTANISTVQVLRAEIATHKACTDPGCDL